MHRGTLFSVVLALSVPCGLAKCVDGQHIVAHRGASFDAPENTLAAFCLAWEQGADAIEADFRLSRDGQIVCIHDENTERVAGVKRLVVESSLRELQALDVGAWKDQRWRGQRIPTLRQVLATVPPRGKIFVELKTGPEIVEPLAAALACGTLSMGQVIVISFDEETIAACERRLPELNTQWLTRYENEHEDESGAWSPTATEVVATLRRIGADGLGSQAELRHVNAAFLGELSRHGFAQSGVWTVNDVETAQHYRQLDAWSITTDRPGWLREQLATGGTSKPDDG